MNRSINLYVFDDGEPVEAPERDLQVAIEGFENRVDYRTLAGIGVDQQIGIGATLAVEQLLYGQVGGSHLESR